MILLFDYIGYKRLSENKRFPNHRWYSDATWGGGDGWKVIFGLIAILKREPDMNSLKIPKG